MPTLTTDLDLACARLKAGELLALPTETVYGLAADALATVLRGAELEVAPLAATAALGFVIVAALGLLTIALDHVVLTARMPLLAAVALVIVWLIPAIAVPAGVDVVAFVVLAGGRPTLKQPATLPAMEDFGPWGGAA